MMEFVKRIDWLGHASFRLRGEKTVYFDPWKLDAAPHDADIVFVTHSHYDHHSEVDIEKVARKGTIVVGPASDRDTLKYENVVLCQPGERKTVAGLTVQAVPAYNTNKKFHPKENNWLGYVVEIDGVRVYHAGDTDVIDEMYGLAVDVALLPVSGTYVMTAQEALEAARRVGAKVVIPMHWGDIIGGRGDAQTFEKSAPCPVVIKEPV